MFENDLIGEILSKMVKATIESVGLRGYTDSYPDEVRITTTDGNIMRIVCTPQHGGLYVEIKPREEVTK